MKKTFNNFPEFYAFYLEEHSSRMCLRLHIAGSTLALAILFYAIFAGPLWWLLGVPVAGYSFAWAGHFFFQDNVPATFGNPIYSLIGNWKMFADYWIGRIPR